MLLSRDHVNWRIDEVFYENDSVLAYARGGTGLYGIIRSDREFEFRIGRTRVLDHRTGACLEKGPVRTGISRTDQRGPLCGRVYYWEPDVMCECGQAETLVFA